MATLNERRTWRRVRVSLVRERADQPYALRDGGDVVALVAAFLRDDPREHFAAVYLDQRHRPIAVHDVAIGGSDPLVNARDNVFYNTVANGTGVSFAIGTASATFAISAACWVTSSTSSLTAV